MYGLLERQFHLTFDRASRQRGITGENLLLLLERRLDNMIYRMGFARTRREARQMVRHGHFLVNGKKMSIPSSLLKIGDAVERRGVPAWIELERNAFKATVKAYPTREDITMPIQEQMIVELYSK